MINTARYSSPGIKTTEEVFEDLVKDLSPQQKQDLYEELLPIAEKFKDEIISVNNIPNE